MLLDSQYSAWILLVGVVLVLAQPPADLPRQYLARRDFFNMMKAGEFSIMDPSEKKLYYRIESRYHLLQRVEVIRYPEKKKTARLASKLHPLTYRGEFSILNETTNRWVEGVTEQNFQWLQFLYIIRWNGHQINLTSTTGDQTCRFRDESNELLADYRLQLASVLWRRKYDVKIHTNKYPEEIYLLALAAHDRITSSSKNGWGQWTTEDGVFLIFLQICDIASFHHHRE